MLTPWTKIEGGRLCVIMSSMFKYSTEEFCDVGGMGRYIKVTAVPDDWSRIMRLMLKEQRFHVGKRLARAYLWK